MNSSNRKILGASKLVNSMVVNPEGKKLGKLDSLMIDLHLGNIAYAVLSFEEFLDLKDKLFALPWHLFQVDQAKKLLVINITRDKLKEMPGFDKHYWPDMEDPFWQSQIAQYYHDFS